MRGTWNARALMGAIAVAGAFIATGCSGHHHHYYFSNATATPSATRSTVSAGNTPVPADGKATVRITVTLLDANGKPVVDVAVIPKPSGPQTLFSISSLSDANGVVTIDAASTVPQSETISFTALASDGTATTLAQTASVTFTPVASNSTGSTIAATPTSVLADGTTASTVTVTVKDDVGNVVPGAGVTFSVASGSNVTLSATGQQTSDASGLASVNVTSTTAQTGVTIAALVSGATSSFTLTSPAITFTPGNPMAIQFEAVPTNITAGVPFTLNVDIVDAHGNLVPTAGNEVVLALPNDCLVPNAPAVQTGGLFAGMPGVREWVQTGGGGARALIKGSATDNPSLQTGSVNTIVVAQNGVARFTALICDKAGTFQTQANATGLGTAGASFTVSPNVATQLLFDYRQNGALGLSVYDSDLQNNPSTVNSGDVFGKDRAQNVGSIAVYAGDAFGNITSNIPGGSAAHSITLTGNSGLTLGGTTTVTMSNGVALFPNVTASGAANASFTVGATDTPLASAPALSPATSGAFEVVGATNAIAIQLSGLPTTIQAGQTVTLTATLVDGSGNQATAIGGSGGTTPVNFSLAIYNSCGAAALFQSGFTVPVSGQTTISVTVQQFQPQLAGGNAFHIATFNTTDQDTNGASFRLLDWISPGTVKLTPGAPSFLAFTQTPGCGYAPGTLPPNVGTAQRIAPDIQVTAFDADGNVANVNDQIQLALTVGTGKFTFGSQNADTITLNATNGVATFSSVSISPAASYQITASDLTTGSVTPTNGTPGPSNVTGNTSPLTLQVFDAGTPAALRFLTSPTNAMAGDFADQLPGNATIVQIVDAFGNPVGNRGLNVVVSLQGLPSTGLGDGGQLDVDAFGNSSSGFMPGANSGQGTNVANTFPPSLSGGTETDFQNVGGTTDQRGIVTFGNNVAYNAAAIGFRVYVSSGGLNNACSAPFDVVPGPGSGTNWTASILLAPDSSIVATQTTTVLWPARPNVGVPVVQVYDDLGNVATGWSSQCTVTVDATSYPRLTSLGQTVLVPAEFNGSRTAPGTTIPFVSGNAVFYNLTISGQVVSGTYDATDSASYGMIFTATNMTFGPVTGNSPPQPITPDITFNIH